MLKPASCSRCSCRCLFWNSRALAPIFECLCAVQQGAWEAKVTRRLSKPTSPLQPPSLQRYQPFPSISCTHARLHSTGTHSSGVCHLGVHVLCSHVFAASGTVGAAAACEWNAMPCLMAWPYCCYMRTRLIRRRNPFVFICNTPLHAPFPFSVAT